MYKIIYKIKDNIAITGFVTDIVRMTTCVF